MKLHLPKSLLAFALTCVGAACLTLPAAYAEDLAQDGGDAITRNDGGTYTYDTISINGVTFSVTNGTTVQATTFIGSNASTATTTNVNIGSADAESGATKSILEITGTDSASDLERTHYHKYGNLRISHWPHRTNLNIYADGEVRALDAVVDTAGDGTSITTINGGEMNVKGLSMEAGDSHIVVENSGKLNLGSYGIQGYSGSPITFSTNATLGALEATGFSTNYNLTMGSSTIQTDRYIVGETGAYSGDGVDIVLGGTLTTTAANTLAGSGSLTISNTLDHALNLAAGATATLKVSSLVNFECYLAEGTEHGRSSAYVIMKEASNITSAMVGSTTYNLENSGNKMLLQTGSDVYAVRSGTAVYDATTSVSPSDFSGVSQIILSGGVLDMKTGLTDVEDGILVSRTASDAAPVISLAKSVVLDNADLNVASGSSVQLAGSGTYALGSTVNIPTGVSVLTEDLADGSAEKWTGTVQVGTGTSYTTIAGQRFDSLCTTDSVVELKGLRGYLVISGSSATASPHTANFKLTDSGDIKALVINNGSSTQYYNFSGNISGDGSIVRDGTKAGSAWTAQCQFHFSGDVSAWEGQFLNEVNGRTDLHFTGSAQELNMNLGNTGTSTMYVNIDNAADVTVTGDITGNTEVNYKQGGNKTVSSEASDYEGNTTISAGKVTLASSKALGDSAQTNVNSGATLAVQAGVTEIDLGADTNTITVKSGATLALNQPQPVSVLTLGGGAPEGYTPVEVTGAMTLEAGSTFDASYIASLPLTFDATTGKTTIDALTTTGTLTVGEGVIVSGLGSTMVGSVAAVDNTLSLTLTKCCVTGVSGYDADNDLLTFTTNLDADAVLSGTVDFATLGLTAPQLGELIRETINNDAEWMQQTGVYLSFLASDGTTLLDLSQVTGLSVVGHDGIGTVTADGTKIGMYMASAIPEPTTATLSLLALAGLAARRRRK